MDEPARASTHVLHVLALLILVESAVAFAPGGLPHPSESAPSYQTVPSRTVLNLMSALLLPVGVAALISIRTDSKARLKRIAVFALAIQILSDTLTLSGWLSGPFLSRFGVLHFPAFLLVESAAPLLWASALARRDRPLDPGLQKIGRLSAGLIQLGFVFTFAYEALSTAAWRRVGTVGGTYGMYALGMLIHRLLILWASIDSVRASAEEEVVRHRAHRIHKLMVGWLIAAATTTAASTIMWKVASNSGDSGELRYTFWRSAVHMTLTLTTTAAVTRALAARPPSAS